MADAASPLTSNLLGPEWYPSDGALPVAVTVDGSALPPAFRPIQG